MPWDPVKNFAKVFVQGYYGATDTSIVLQQGEGSKLPNPSTEGAFNMVWWNATDYQDPTDDPYREIVRVTAKSGDTLTVTRGQENTTAQPHNISGKTYKMMLTLTKKTYEDLQTIEVYKDGTLIGQRGSFDFIGFQTITDDAPLKRIKVYAPDKFGGDGSDGDLVISTGTTTIDLGGNKIFVKNYNNLKITGTAALNFINPHNDGTLIIFRVKGDCELTSTANPGIDLRNIGSLNERGFFPIMAGKKADAYVRNPTVNWGTGGASAVNDAPNIPENMLFSVYTTFDWNSNTFTATGRRGGGGLLIEVAGNLTVSSSFVINASGSNGNTNSGSASSSGTSATGYCFWRKARAPYFVSSSFVPREFLPLPGGGGGDTFVWQASGTFQGGGGAGGSVLIVYKGTKTGTDPNIIVAGGTGGNNFNGADGIGLVVNYNKLQ